MLGPLEPELRSARWAQGEGEDGLVLLLVKMNLELLRRHWMHSESWWPRLLVGHAVGGPPPHHDSPFLNLLHVTVERHASQALAPGPARNARISATEQPLGFVRAALVAFVLCKGGVLDTAILLQSRWRRHSARQTTAC